MGIATRSVQLLLFSLSGLAAYSFYTILWPQGLAEAVRTFADKRLLPGTTISVDRVQYTGIGFIDWHIHALNLFFWPVLSDTDYVRRTRSRMFVGQFMTGWALVMLESERPGNRGRLWSYIIFWGLATQSVGWALAMPTWMALMIGGSWLAKPTASQVTPDSRAGRAIPYSIIVGFLLPGLLAYLPAPKIWTYEQKLLAMGAWQVFPIWTAISQYAFKSILPDYAVEAQSSRARSWGLTSALKAPYLFVLVTAGLIRLGSIAVIIYDIQYSALAEAPTWSIFRTLLFPKTLDPTIMYDVPAAGSAAFLEWDETVGQAALVIYSAFQCFMVWRPRNGSDYAFLLIGLPVTWLLFGSSGLAVVYLATRDSTVIRRGAKTKKLKQ